MVGDAGDHDARGEEESCFQAQRALVVQQVFPPVANDVFGDKHTHRVSRAGPANVADEVEDRSGDLPVGRVDNFQLDGDLTCAPFVDNRLCFLLVNLNGDRGQCAGWVARAKARACRVGRTIWLTGTIAWMRLGRLTPAGVGVISAATRS